MTPTKRAAPQRSNSVKVTALTMLKTGDRPLVDVARQLQIPVSTLKDWRRASKATGNWDIAGSAGDNNINNNVARPAPRAKDPGSGGHNKIIDDRMKRRIRTHLDQDPFLTPAGLQSQIPELRNVSKQVISRCIAKDLGMPSRKAATKPHLTSSQRIRHLDWAQRRSWWTQRKWRKILWSDETHIEMWRGF